MLRTLIAAMGLCTLVATDANGLSFKVIQDDGYGSRVLLIYDCGAIRDNRECPAQPGFVEEDVRRLSDSWRAGPFDEVWLLSGGGDLEAKIRMARDLRAHAQAVRVPNTTRLLKAGMTPARPPFCVSSCTVAFMGGQFRAIDMVPGDQATYEVHASSSVSWGRPAESAKMIQAVRDVAGKNGIHAVIATLTRDDAETARDLFVVFQEALWLPIKPRSDNDPERTQRDAALSLWLRELNRRYVYSDTQAIRDREILDLEGDAALQDIIMRAERESMVQAIDQLQTLRRNLGRRADEALAMLTAMYDTSSILETNQVPKETLLKMGYITEFVR